jgi:NAD(P)-dependent dehydrogenase (short-subunit alcohol dehydrogenase family)
MRMGLEGRVALVTGAASGVGRAIALALASEGAAVAVNYHRSGERAQAVVEEIAAQGGRAVACQADIADFAAVTRMVGCIADELGGLDILVNNAGFVVRKRFADTTPEDWRRQIDACLYGAIHCCHAAIPLLPARGNGRIISLTGDSSRVGESGLSIAAAARAGVIALMKSLARELGGSGTTANAVSLGLVETAHDSAWVDANREKLVKFYALRRLGHPGDVAPLVTLLASDRGSWITGQVVSVNGGFSML